MRREDGRRVDCEPSLSVYLLLLVTLPVRWAVRGVMCHV